MAIKIFAKQNITLFVCMMFCSLNLESFLDSMITKSALYIRILCENKDRLRSAINETHEDQVNSNKVIIKLNHKQKIIEPKSIGIKSKKALEEFQTKVEKLFNFKSIVVQFIFELTLCAILRKILIMTTCNAQKLIKRPIKLVVRKLSRKKTLFT